MNAINVNIRSSKAMTIKYFIIVATIVFTGCATGYHESWHSDGGFNEERLHPEYPIYSINSKCNGYTSSERCSDIALRRSAELCKDNRYDGFTVMDRNHSVSQHHGQFTYNTTETVNTRVHSSYHSNYGYHGYGNAYATTTYQQPHTVNYTINKPKTSMSIGCLQRKDYRNFTIVYDNFDVLNKTAYLVQ